MKFIFLAVLLVIIFYSCNSIKKTDIHSTLIATLSAEDPNEFSFYSHIIIFCKCENNKVGYLDIYGLNKNFNIPKYNELGYPKFISEVINLNLEVDSLATYLSFSLNDTITAEYNNVPFDNFLGKYTDRSSDEDEYRIISGLNYESTLTILYYLYQNNFYSSFDDYIGYFYSHKGLPPVVEEETDLIFESD